MVPFSEWPLANGIIVPIPIHLANNFGVESPAKPPMSGPENGCPLNDCKITAKELRSMLCAR
jgi:hypothetical protein